MLKKYIADARMLIKMFEGCKLQAYQKKDDVPTIGYGTTIYQNGKRVKLGDVITQEQAERELSWACSAIDNVLTGLVKNALNDKQLASLISLIYNIGIGNFKDSTMLRLINNRKVKEAANEFDRWIYNNGKVVNGLIARRKKEKEVFLS